MNTSPMCCGTVSSYVDNVPGKEYYYCKECKNEVLATPNNEMSDLFPGKPVIWSSNQLGYGNIVAGPAPRDVIAPELGAQKIFFDTETVAEVVRSSIDDIFVGQVFELFHYSPSTNPCLVVVSVDRQTGTVTMKVVADPLEDEEQDETFDY